LLLVAVLELSPGAPHADGADTSRFASPGQLDCEIALLTKDGAMTASEPLIARVEIVNRSDEQIRLRTGNTTYLTVRDATGALVAATPRPKPAMDDRYGVRRLASGETYSTYWIVSGLCQFDTPGRYAVRVQQLGFPPELAVLCEGAASLEVLPYDAARIEAACEEVFRNRSSFGSLPIGVRSKALYSVRDDVALPYLDWMAREWESPYACLAIRRIGTPRAEGLIAALAARTDGVGEAARRALEMSLEPTYWDVDAR
jgi:hypothetical protein